MSVSASQLRQDIYRLIDEVLRTGEPLEIERKGRRLLLVAEQSTGRLDRIRGNPDAIVGDPEDLVTMDWSTEWEPDRTVRP